MNTLSPPCKSFILVWSVLWLKAFVLVASLHVLSADIGIKDARFETLRVELPVLDGIVYTAERYSGIDAGKGNFSWVGKLTGPRRGFVSLGRVNDSVNLMASFSDSSYFYRGKVNNFTWQKKISKAKPCGGCRSMRTTIKDPRQRRAQSRSTWQNGDGNLIDLVFVYPGEVRAAAGSTANIEAAILAAVGDVNLCFRNSQINLIARMVHMEEISYTPTGILSTDLDRLIDKNDNYLDSVHSIRDQYSGDIVILLTTDGNLGGLASTLSYPHHDFESSAFNVTVWDQMGAPDFTLTHEIGHNMGCLHNIEDTSNISEYFVFSGFSYGKRWVDNGQGYRTVMSYDTDPTTYGQLIPYFSNPAVNFGTVATGDSGIANNAQVLMSTAPYVANFRSSSVQGIVASNYDIRAYEGDFSTSFGVRLAAKPNSSVTINLSKSGDPDLFVGSPMTLLFDSSNWNLEQTVQILAKADTDLSTGTGNLMLSASGIPSLNIPLTEFDSGTTNQSELYLTGVVKNSLGAGIGGVSISFSNNGGFETTNSRGAFVKRMPMGWSGNITLSKDNFSFSPAQEIISTLSEDQLALSFVGTQPNILYVDASASGDSDGSSWGNAFTDLNEALSSSIPNIEIWVAQGTYKPGSVRSSKFIIPPGTHVYGGFTGTETLREQRQVAGSPTILSGDIGITSNGSDNSFHVVLPLQDSVLDGFTIRDGNASENFGEGDDRGKGGGLYGDSSTFTLANCIFTNNNAKQGGGAVYVKDSNVSFFSCSFVSNSANSVGSGGAVLIDDSNASFSTSSFLNNLSAYQGGAIRFTNSIGSVIESNFTQNLNTLANGGGAIYLDNSPINFRNCTFSENSTQANNYGGAVKLSASSANFSNCQFTHNSSPQGSAGAVYVDSSSSPTFLGNEFHYNSSGQFAGAIFTESSITLSEGIFLGNYSNYGGGISNIGTINLSFEKILILGNEANASGTSNGGFAYFSGSGADTLFVNCIISGNKSSDVNGVFRANGSNRFVNCSIIGNQSGSDGGIALLYSGDSVELDNSIIWQNTSLGNGNDFFVNNQSISANHSIFDPSQSTESVSGINNQNINPGLIDANGADNLFGTLDDNFSLLANSPAINAGSTEVSSYQNTDLIGNSRVGLPEIGAYEFLSNSLPVLSMDSAQTAFENTSIVGQVKATDANGDTLAYSITGGSDQSLFSIKSSTGELSFLVSPDFENRLDTDTDNIYNVQVSVSDGVGSVSIDLQIEVNKDPSTVFTVSGGQGNFPYYEFTDGNGHTLDFSSEYLYLGETYTFTASGISDSHPFMIGESYGGTDSSFVTGGPLTGSEGVISVSIPNNFSGSLLYYCTDHSGMNQLFSIQAPPHIVELNSSLAMEMLWVEPGSFTMGTPTTEAGRLTDENETQVTLTRGFYLGKFEVTQAEYELVMSGNSDGINATPSNFHGNPAQPVERVTHDHVQIFLQRLNAQMDSSIPAGWAYILPTEAQWEYACRAGTSTVYSWGGSITSGNANYNWDGTYNSGSDYQQTREVGLYTPNTWGFHDMHGNVREWVADWYGEYLTGPLTDPSGPSTGDQRVLRGGAWWDKGVFLRSGIRHKEDSGFINGGVGFRLAFQNINNPPLNLSALSSLFFEENLPIGTAVGQFIATDSDGDSLSYLLTSGQGDSGNILFDMEDNGTLRTAVFFDYESNATSYSIRVLVKDENNASLEGVYTLQMSDVFENRSPGNLMNLGLLTFPENLTIGTVVGEFSATDLDNHALNYSLTSGQGDSGNNLFAMEVNGTLRTASIFDYELNVTSFSIRVQVVDELNSSMANEFTISLTDLDDTVPVIFLNGDSNISHEAGQLYQDANATWVDNSDGNGTLLATGNVDTYIPGIYVLNYNHTDFNGNTAHTVSRIITVVDSTPPVITLQGDTIVMHEAGQSYQDPNATWMDTVDGNGVVIGTGVVDTDVLGTYLLYYDYSDSSGNSASRLIREVRVVDRTPPVINLIGESNIIHQAGMTYTDANATWADAVDGNGILLASGSVNEDIPGNYYLNFNYVDSSGNAASTITRVVTVIDDTGPVITLNGDAYVTHEAGELYIDARANWADSIDGTGLVIGTGSVDTNMLGVYLLSYNFTDSNGNAASSLEREVRVVDTKAPVITVIGDANVTHEAGEYYIDANATWADAVDGSGVVEGTGFINSSLPGVYTISYNFVDSSGNIASTVSRIIDVVDTTPPIIILNGEADVTHEAGLNYIDANATLTDNVDENRSIIATGYVNTNILGSYLLSYDYTDAAGNIGSSVERTVRVSDTTAPVITINGAPTITLTVAQSYLDSNAVWSDFVDGSGTLLANGNVDINIPGIYELSYNFVDSSGNAASTVVRKVIVIDENVPVISLNGPDIITHPYRTDFIDLGAEAYDDLDGNLTSQIERTGTVNVNTAGEYELIYSVSNSVNNEAAPVVRKVVVDDSSFNRTPTALSNLHLLGVKENQPIGTYIGEFNATDPDEGVVSFAFVEGFGDNHKFNLLTNGVLQTNEVLDYESSDQLEIKVRASVTTGEYVDRKFEVQIFDQDLPSVTTNPIEERSQSTLWISGRILDQLDSDLWSYGLYVSSDIQFDSFGGEGVTDTPLVLNEKEFGLEFVPNSDVQKVYIMAYAENLEGRSFGLLEEFDVSKEQNSAETSFLGDLTDATPVEGSQGWWESSWMGYYSAETYPWIYHFNLGWIFVSNQSVEGLWFYHSRLGWLWTNSSQYPYLYFVKRNQWIYLNKSITKTTVYDFEEDEWFEPDTPIKISSNLIQVNKGEIYGYGDYYRWETVVLEARVKNNFNFAGWSGDLSSMDKIIEFVALRNLNIDASFIAIPSNNVDATEVIGQARSFLDKMDHLNQAEKEKSLAELLIFGKSSTSGLSIINDL